MKVLMLPWLAYGHISPFIELAKRLSHSNFHSYICSTPINLTLIKSRIPQNYSISIHLVELHLPSLPDLPPHYHTTNGLPLSLHSTLKKASKMAKPNFLTLLQNLQPDLVIHDILQSWAATLASHHNIPSVAFFTSGATMFSYFCHLGKHPGIEFPFPSIRLSDFEKSMALTNMAKALSDDQEKDPDEEEHHGSEDGIILLNSSRAMEGKYMDYLSEMIKRSIVPTGTLVVQDHQNVEGHDQLMEWLGDKPQASTVYVSFGSEFFLDKNQIQEIAYALELSCVNFIWVIRFPKGEHINIHEVLPGGFLDRSRGIGKVVENWAPQAKILAHSSIGAFVSHCGWNSLLESIENRVPTIAVPMHLDQPMNAKLVMELGVGVQVERGGNGQVAREKISDVIKEVVHGKTGEHLRAKLGQVRETNGLKSKEEMKEVANMLMALVSANN